MKMLQNIKYSNIEVTNKTVIGNLNFKTYDNIYM